MQSRKQAAAPECPVGESHCPVIDEVIGLREQVVTDPLTGLYNIRYFHQALEQELERTERTRIATAVMMIDLDFFKSINDTWGHEAGNDVLKQTADIIRAGTRRLDVQCRYGGEEFVVILPSTERRLAVQVAERLRENIATHPFPAAGQTLNITASIGLAFHNADNPADLTGLVASADHFLYKAKRDGRNRVCFPPFEVEEAAVSGEERSALGSMFSDQEDDGETFEGDWSE
ncbi:MAG: GGDEF domain-containing protein [Oceanospirillaceae bacterium]|nr:GGDEF domain-containing protein [Oceanospirillaceae bacterium]|tara:strand:- start:19492 stop:20187 length:696 start_codon:yes stop_codon:yes gene_type:complete